MAKQCRGLGGVLRALCACVVCLLSLFGATRAFADNGRIDLNSIEIDDATQDSVVLVSIEDYAFVPDIVGASANALLWYEFFTSHLKIDPDRIAFLNNEQATRERILSTIGEKARSIGPRGRLWVIFIGHGATSTSGDGLMLGVDVQQTIESVNTRGVPRAEVLRRIDGGEQKEAFVIIDSCFSGLVSVGTSIVPGSQPLLPSRNVEVRENLTVMTAAMADQFAGSLPGLKRPAFSYLLLGAIAGWGDKNHDGVVTTDEAIGFVRTTLVTALRGRRNQTPTLVAANPRLPMVTGRRLLDVSTQSSGELSFSTTEYFAVEGDGETERRDGSTTGTEIAAYSLLILGGVSLLTGIVFSALNAQNNSRVDELTQSAEINRAEYDELVSKGEFFDSALGLSYIVGFSTLGLGWYLLPDPQVKGANVSPHNLRSQVNGRAFVGVGLGGSW